MASIGDIFRTFSLLGCTAFGGLAMIEPIRREVVERRQWLSQADFLDGLALCQLLPGATVVQLATYVGFRLQHTPGALTAASAFVLPAFVLMVGLTLLYLSFGQLAWAQAVSRGLGAVVIALLLQTTYRLARTLRSPWHNLALALVGAAAIWFRVNYLAVFLSAGIIRAILARFSGWQEEIAPGAAAVTQPSQGPRSALMIALVSVLLFVGLRWCDQMWSTLAAIFVKIGLVSFGGGYVMIPILQWEVVDRWQWLTLRQFLDGILLSYATPGPLLILAAFVGFLLKGVPGAGLATVAVFLPPVLLITCLIPYYQKIKGLSWMRPFIQGVLSALLGMLAVVTVQMGGTALSDWRTVALMLAAAVALIGFEIHLIWVVIPSAMLSLALFW
jgi:chromate transporter